MKQILAVFLCLTGVLSGFSQNRTVQGKVITADDPTGLPGVNVIVKGTTNGTATDADGKYQIQLGTGENTLVFTFIGYKTMTVDVADRTIIDITLEADAKTLGEVVIVGYGTQRKSDLTGAVSSVRGSDLIKVPALDPNQALMGKVAGVQVVNSSGAPGTVPTVRIRGVGTFNNSAPIYVVDGVILDDIGFLNSNDIQSMEVLKDASATAIYGSRGANGVIIVTTKQGTKGKDGITVNVTTDGSVQQLQKEIALLNGKQFATVINEITPTYNNIDLVPNTDWQNQIFKRANSVPDFFKKVANGTMPAIQNYQISVSGSSAAAQYYVGVGYFKQDGIIPKSSYERLTIKLNSTFHISKFVRVGTNITFAPHSQQNTDGSAVFNVYRAEPVITPYQSDGTYSPVPGVGNPLAGINYTNDYAKGLRTVGNIFGEVDFLKMFMFRSSFGVDLVYNKDVNYTPVFFVNAQQQNSISLLNKGWHDQSTLLWENTLNFNKEIGRHRFNALGGFTMQNVGSEGVQLQAKNVIRDSKDFWYITPTTIVPTATSNTVDLDHYYSMMSLLARVNYTFDERFLFTATFRRDGSSKFLPQNRFGNFPSFAAGWNIINEDFMKQFSFISNLKVRGSWGILGNEKINSLGAYSVVNNAIGVFGTNPAVVPGLSYGALGNPNIKWETTYQTDAGLELGFFNNKLTAEFDYYHRDTRKILISLQVPGYLGNNGAPIIYNAGEVLNRGFEMNLGWQDHLTKDFSYRIGVIGTTIHNETLKVTGTGASDDFLYGVMGNTITKTYKGVPLGSFYGYQVGGVFQNAADLAAYPHLSGTGVGNLKFLDTNHDGVIDGNDRVTMGSPIPTLMYGFNTEMSYKALQLSADFNGQSGNKIYNYKETVRPDQYNYEEHVINRWTGDGTSNTEPRASAGGNDWLPSTRFIQNGAYIRLRSITLAWNLPAGAAQSIKVKALKIYVRGTNVFTHTKYTGYTPEIAPIEVPGVSSPGTAILNGVDTGTYPIPAIYSAGLNVTF